MISSVRMDYRICHQIISANPQIFLPYRGRHCKGKHGNVIDLRFACVSKQVAPTFCDRLESEYPALERVLRCIY